MIARDRKRRAPLAATAAVVGLLVCLAGAAAANAATITVDSTADSSADDGACMLREAIVAANDNTASGVTAGECAGGDPAPTVDAIEFSITGAGPHVIMPASALAVIDDPVHIDGSTDGGDEIQIHGESTAGVTHGIHFEAGAEGSVVTALTVTGFDGTNAATGIYNGSAGGIVIESSHVGTDRAGTAGIGNGVGIEMRGEGGTIRDSWVSGNVLTGIELAGSGHVVEGTRVGLHPTLPATGLGNGGTGVSVEARADEMRIGGSDPGDLNRIAGNGGSGIIVNGFSFSDPQEGSFDNVIEGNRIGTSGTGQAAVPNSGDGIALLGTVARSEIRDNLISGNASDGIFMSALVNMADGAPGPSENLVAGNLIGTDVDGDTALGNGDDGVRMSSGFTENAIAGNVIGGDSAGACGDDCNTISGNGSGVRIYGSVTENEILGNLIGLEADGIGELPNTFGVTLEELSGIVPTANRIGAPGAGNVIAGNASLAGIALRDAVRTTIQANLIGVAADGLTPRPNGDEGIRLWDGADGNLIGGTASGERNLILFADGHGVAVAEGTDNSILGNVINVNSGLGIDLEGGVEDAFGVTTNDPLDGDAGSNELQNFPEIDTAVAGASTTVIGELESEPESAYRIEVFATNVADVSGFGEGRTLLGAFELTTDAGGLGSFTRTLAGSSTAGEVITATATRLDGGGAPLSTSELSEAVAAGECDIIGTEEDDVLVGTTDSEMICGLGGDDVIEPGGGDDVIVGGDGTDEIDLSAASGAVDLDLVTGAGTAGADELAVLEVEDVTGSDFADAIAGDAGDNVIAGGPGDDTIDGGNGADTLSGQNGIDTLSGGPGADTVKGGPGKDALNGDEGGDTLKGQEGVDTIVGGAAADTLQGGPGKDTLKGQDGADVLKGQDGADTIKGGAAGDELAGGDGSNDDLDGNDGRDSLNGGSGGGDDCHGGPGNDDTPAPGCEVTRSIP